ncbi:MAG: hypothetical protein LBN03_01620 [Bifidobacteriaceae bacterium]|jgi:hypothetical protein|nr:hypothetical protein [Bifidobacteriaceae bacterium]
MFTSTLKQKFTTVRENVATKRGTVAVAATGLVTTALPIATFAADDVWSRLKLAGTTIANNLLGISIIAAVVVVAWTAFWQGLITKDKDFGRNIRNLIIAFLVLIGAELIITTVKNIFYGTGALKYNL